MTKIADYIRKLAEAGEELYSKVCKVNSVDQKQRTCNVTPLDDAADIMDVRLQADMSMTSGLLILPAVGSNVLVSFLNKNVGYVSGWSEIDSIILRDDSDGGLVKVEPLTSRLNAVEQDLNSLKTVFKTWLIAPSDGGAALKTAAASWYGQNINPTKRSDLENTNVKHG